MGTLAKVKRRGPWPALRGGSPSRRKCGRTLPNLSTRRSQSGQVQVSLVLVLLLALGAGYLFYALYPAFLDEIDVRTNLHSIANDGWHHTGREDLHRKVIDKLRTIGFHYEPSEDGRPVRVTGLELAEDDVVVTCTDRGQDCSESDGQVFIEVHYQRSMPLPGLTGKNVTLRFNPHAEATLSAVAW
jgi:hypothetical protein